MDHDLNLDTQTQRALLQAFLREEGTSSPGETESLNPILNALKKNEPRYQNPELIAEGGEKRVYKIYDRHLNRFVAMAQAAKAETDDDYEQFLRESQLTANLNHPNIVPVHNMGLDQDGTPFFSMELVQGDSFQDIIDNLRKGDTSYRARYPLATLLSLFNKVCDAVAYAHSRNVLHLDIKPANIRVGKFGEVCLCDWGLARIEDHLETGETDPGELEGDLLNAMTLTGIMKGTPGFMAPEQVTKRQKTRQTDIYALGALLYLILTHKLPVDGKDATEIVANTRKGRIVHPRRRKPLPSNQGGLAAVAVKALALDPDDRYADVQALQADIARYQTGLPTDAQHANLFCRSLMFLQRHRSLTLWLMAFFALMVLVMGINLSIIRREKQNAETNFTLYKKEHEESRRINEKLTSLSFHTKDVRSYISARSMIPATDLILEQPQLDPAVRQSILFHKARMHLILQEFNAAADAFRQLQDPDKQTQRMQKLSQTYAATKPTDQEPLSDSNLARFLTSPNFAIPRTFALLIYYHDRAPEHPANPEEHIQVAGAMLNRLSGIDPEHIPELKFSKRRKGWHLDLSNTPYPSFLVDLPMTYAKNILQPLQLYSLDISHTPVCLTRELLELKLKELRMVGVSLEPINEMVGLQKSLGTERLILGKGDYPDSIIQALRNQGIEVIEEEKNIEQ